jgi:hypothetical protein
MRSALVLVLLSLWMAIPAVAQQNLRTLPPAISESTASGITCDSTRYGYRIRTNNASGSTDCTFGSGTGSTVNVCECGEGDAWVDAPYVEAASFDATDLGANSVAASELNANADEVFFCGELGNDGATYGGPNVSFWTGDYSASGAPGGAACNTLGDATETNVDNDVDAFVTFKVMGMYCWVTSAPSNAAGVIMVLHDDTAVTTPSVTCTVAQSETSCTSTTGTTTDIAANSQLAVEATTAEDLSTQDFGCKVYVVPD